MTTFDATRRAVGLLGVLLAVAAIALGVAALVNAADTAAWASSGVVDEPGEAYTLISVVNASDTTQTVTVRFRDAAGAVVATDSKTVVAGTAWAFTTASGPSAPGALAATAGMVGSVEVTGAHDSGALAPAAHVYHTDSGTGIAIAFAGLASAVGDAPPPPTPTPSSPATPTPTPGLYFAGQTVRVLVGFSPGGGYDTHARIASKYLQEHLPGSPDLVIVNLEGAGGERAVTETMAASPDGLTVGLIHPRFVVRDLQNLDVPGFDSSSAGWVGSPAALTATNALYVRSAVATTWAEVLALGDPLSVGNTVPALGPGVGATLIEEKGGPVLQIFGYGGTSEILAAVDRGELDATYLGGPNVAPLLFPEWVDSQFITPVVRWGADPADDAAFVAYLADLGAPVPPHIFDVLTISAAEQGVFQAAEGIDQKLQRSYALPPGMPADVLTLWRTAFADVLADPDYQAEITAAGYGVGLSTGAEIDALIASAKAALADPAAADLFEVLAPPM